MRGSEPTIEVLYFDGCPNCEPIVSRIPKLLAEGGIDADVRLRTVRSEGHARRARFLGSPTVRINGHDVEPGADARTDYGLKCRLYRTSEGLAGVPEEAWIVDSLERYTSNPSGTDRDPAADKTRRGGGRSASISSKRLPRKAS